MERINIRISCELEHIGLMGMAVNGICQRFPEDVSWKIELSVIEAITNVIKYACQYSPDKQVDLGLTIQGNQLKIVISDDGHSMDIARFEAGRVLDFDRANALDLEEGGRGLGLIHSLMDEVDYQSDEGINQLILTKNMLAVAGDDA